MDLLDLVLQFLVFTVCEEGLHDLDGFNLRIYQIESEVSLVVALQFHLLLIVQNEAVILEQQLAVPLVQVISSQQERNIGMDNADFYLLDQG